MVAPYKLWATGPQVKVTSTSLSTVWQPEALDATTDWLLVQVRGSGSILYTIDGMTDPDVSSDVGYVLFGGDADLIPYAPDRVPRFIATTTTVSMQLTPVRAVRAA